MYTLPALNGLFTAFWAIVPITFLVVGWTLYELPNAVMLVASIITAVGSGFVWRRLNPGFRARTIVESLACWLFFLCAATAVLITFAIAFTLIFESIRFFTVVPITEFLFGLRWNPATDAFGTVPIFVGTFLITLIAIIVAVPMGLFSAIYLSFYAKKGTRTLIKPLLEVLAGVPTVVYGFCAIIAIAPSLQKLGNALGLSVAAESALGVGLVMGIMIIPYISSLSDDVLSAVPRVMREGSLALGATESEGIVKVMIPAALPGIMASILLAISRAIGETMIVVMAAGYSARLSISPLDALTTVTVQIVSMLTGDQVFDSPKTLGAFALGLTLFLITLVLNLIALRIVRHYREKYE